MLLHEKQKIIVFGVKDTFCGQIVNSRQFKSKFEIAKEVVQNRRHGAKYNVNHFYRNINKQRNCE